MIDGLGHTETGVLADIDLVKHLFGAFVGEKQGPENGGKEIAAPRTYGKGKYKPVEAAPGRYVTQKAA